MENADNTVISSKLATASDIDREWIGAFLGNPANDDAFLDGLHHYLDSAASARFLNSIKLDKCGEWLGQSAPARLQIRIMEASRSSQHPAYQAFKAGLARSGGLEKAYPKSAV